MTRKNLEDVFEKLDKTLSGHQMVLQLVQQGAGEYERGRILGQIQMLTKLKSELLEEKKDKK